MDDSISRFVDGVDAHVRIRTPRVRRLMCIKPELLRGHLRWLNERGYIRDLELSRGHAAFSCALPRTWNWSSDLPEARNA